MDKRFAGIITGLILFVSMVSMLISFIIGVTVLCDIIFGKSKSFGILAVWIAIFIFSCFLKVAAAKRLEKNNGAE